MQISRYINIPRSESTNSSHHKYLSYSELLISLLTGILLICFTQINQYVATQSQFEVIYLLSGIVGAKFVFPVNYMCKRKIPKTHLQQEAKIHVRALFVPSFIKSLLYFGLMMLILYLGWLLIVLPVAFCTIGVQIMHYRLYKSNQIDLFQTVYRGNHTSGNRNRTRKSCISIRELFVQLLLITALLLHVEVFQLVFSIPTVIAICFCGSLCLLSYYYLHNQIFQLYQSDVDQILAKEYPIQLFNFIFYCLVLYYSTSANDQSYSDLTASSTNLESRQPSPKFWFILQYPIHTFVSVCFSILYQYFCFEMIKKISFKYLFLSQLTGVFWFNLYYFKSGITTSLYFSTFLSFIALILLTRLISIQKFSLRISRFVKWIRKKQHKKMVQQN